MAQRRISHLLVPATTIAVVGLMIVPLHPLLLDLLLSIDIALAVVLLLTALYVRQPVEFSVFPSLLLVMTLLRLSLNVAGTRLILLHGAEGIDAAGNVIMAFGQFVVGGNYVVGVVVFLVLIAIQFVVINHGAVRISEVTARFMLDALPGKQMAIDADLNAGLINEQEARQRRERVRKEADFYGAMDGAVRFTQRDAIAALLITGINIVAGLFIGVVQHGLDLTTAAATFTILTVGEGVVTAIPALLVSMAGGLITTRATAESDLSEEISGQLLAKAGPLALGAAILALLALIPGLPKLAFLVVAGLFGAAAYSRREADRQASTSEPPVTSHTGIADPVASVEPLSVHVGYALIPLVDEKQGGTLLSRVPAIRRQIAADSGLVVPAVHVSDNLTLGPRTYVISLNGVEVTRGELFPDRLLAIDPGTATHPIAGLAAREPSFGLPAWWITDKQQEAALTAGYTVVDPSTALSTHLSETIRSFLPDLLTRQHTKEMVDLVAKSSPKLVEELVPSLVSIGDIQRVLRHLLRERVPVRDLTTILEAMADTATSSKDVEVMAEAVRVALGRAICRQFQNDRGELPSITLSPALEERLLRSVVRVDTGTVLAVDPAEAQHLTTRIARVLESAVSQPVVLCAPQLRPHLWRLLARALPQMTVVSHNEVPWHVRVAPLAVLD